MEIRHPHGTPGDVWRLDMFYMFEPGTKRRKIVREIDDYELMLDGPHEVPKITYGVTIQEKDNLDHPDVILGRFAELEFATPRSGKITAQLIEIEE